MHSVGWGVAHIYRLGPEGYRIYFNDWWLPEDWSRQICGPERGAFQAVALSASASTLFVIDARGRMFTRLYDLDTAGENNLLTYTHLPERVTNSVRGLPAEPWFRQPPIDEGLVTDRITIFQDGEGNAARVLRVEGAREGVNGYFEKRIDGEGWEFHETGLQLEGVLLETTANVRESSPVPPDDTELTGVLSREGLAATVGVDLVDFNLFCSPAVARLVWEGEVLTVDGEPLELELHHVHAMVSENRARDYWLRGVASEVRATLLLSDEIARVDEAVARATLVELFGDREAINFVGEATTDGLDLTEISRSTWFLRPYEEKGRAGQLYRLTAE